MPAPATTRINNWFFVLICIGCLCLLQSCVPKRDDEALRRDIADFQMGLVNEYGDTASTPIPAAERAGFKGIHFYPVNLDYVVTARFTRTPNEKPVAMPTSGKQPDAYVKYGTLQFTLMGKEYTMGLYQSLQLAQSEQYKNYLALLFKDATNGNETYGGGRYIDLHIPSGDTLTINFNKAYQPYCAYTEGYSCPIPPKENILPVRIEAGVKF